MKVIKNVCKSRVWASGMLQSDLWLPLSYLVEITYFIPYKIVKSLTSTSVFVSEFSASDIMPAHSGYLCKCYINESMEVLVSHEFGKLWNPCRSLAGSVVSLAFSFRNVQGILDIWGYVLLTIIICCIWEKGKKREMEQRTIILEMENKVRKRGIRRF